MLLRIETSLAKKEIERYEKNDGIFIPECLDRNGGFLHFAAHNIDKNADTADGKNQLHATNIVAFQDGVHGQWHERKVEKERDKSLTELPSGLVDLAKAPT